MKKTLIILLILISSNIYSQTLSSKDKKAIKYFNKALGFYNSYNYSKTIYWSKLALEEDDKFIEVYYLLSDVYGEIKRPKNKALMLKKAISIAPEKSLQAYYTLALFYQKVGKQLIDLVGRFMKMDTFIYGIKIMGLGNNFS